MNLKKIALHLGCISALFITPTTAPYLGITTVGTFSYLLLLLTLVYEVFTRKNVFTIDRFKTELVIIIIFLLYALFKLVESDFDSIKSSFFFITIPVLISILLKAQPIGIKISLHKTILIFFVIECLLAIYEKIIGVNFFPYKSDIDGSYYEPALWAFRSNAFLGHPLNNALCTSIILSFILVSKYSNFFKILSLCLGFIAILCFNARGATLIWLLLGIYFLYRLYTQQKGKRKQLNKFYLAIIGIIVCSFILYLMIETSLGGRLTNQEKIIDGSAQTRIDVWAAFQYIFGYDLWLGNPKNYLPITYKLGAAGIENSYVVIILNYGLLFGIPLMTSIYFLLRKYLINYNTSQKIIIICSFILIGSLNNSLAGVVPWICFYLCIHVFPYVGMSPKKRNLPQTGLIR